MVSSSFSPIIIPSSSSSGESDDEVPLKQRLRLHNRKRKLYSSDDDVASLELTLEELAEEGVENPAQTCPICLKLFSASDIEWHADICADQSPNLDLGMGVGAGVECEEEMGKWEEVGGGERRSPPRTQQPLDWDFGNEEEAHHTNQPTNHSKERDWSPLLGYVGLCRTDKNSQGYYNQGLLGNAEIFDAGFVQERTITAYSRGGGGGGRGGKGRVRGKRYPSSKKR